MSCDQRRRTALERLTIHFCDPNPEAVWLRWMKPTLHAEVAPN